MPILGATERKVVVIDVERGTSASAQGIGDRPCVPHHAHPGTSGSAARHETGCKIVDRYKDCGVVAFSDRGRRPHRQANRLPAPIEARSCG